MDCIIMIDLANYLGGYTIASARQIEGGLQSKTLKMIIFDVCKSSLRIDTI